LQKGDENAVGCSDKSPEKENDDQHAELRPLCLLVHMEGCFMSAQNNYIYLPTKLFVINN